MWFALVTGVQTCALPIFHAIILCPQLDARDVVQTRDRAGRVGAYDDVCELIGGLEAAQGLDVELMRGAGVERRLPDDSGGDLHILCPQRRDAVAGGPAQLRGPAGVDTPAHCRVPRTRPPNVPEGRSAGPPARRSGPDRQGNK